MVKHYIARVKLKNHSREARVIFASYLTNVIMNIDKLEGESDMSVLDRKIERVADTVSDLIELLYSKNILSIEEIRTVVGDDFERTVTLEPIER